MTKDTIDNPTFLYLDHKFEQMQKRQAKIDRQHKEDQDKVNDKLFTNLSEIKEKVDYTNGTVRKHTDEICDLKNEAKHKECPGEKAMLFIKDYKSKNEIKKTPIYKGGLALALLAGVYGILEGVSNGLEFIFK